MIELSDNNLNVKGEGVEVEEEEEVVVYVLVENVDEVDHVEDIKNQIR